MARASLINIITPVSCRCIAENLEFKYFIEKLYIYQNMVLDIVHVESAVYSEPARSSDKLSERESVWQTGSFTGCCYKIAV